jgi:hypothetical protein
MFEKRIVFKSKYKNFLIPPVPIKKLVPDWYKKIPNFTNKLKNYQSPTIKKCVPVLDSFTTGYAILNPVDIIFWSEVKDNNLDIHWRTPRDVALEDLPKINIGIQTHDISQIHKDFVRDDEFPMPFKFLNPWVIETPKDYSCLFVNPLNSSKDRFIRIIDAIVDTDTYNHNQVNFPFFLKRFKKDETILLKKGEPIALVFPFKRDNWKMSVENLDMEDKLLKDFRFFNNIVDNYKSKTWKRKSYD